METRKLGDIGIQRLVRVAQENHINPSIISLGYQGVTTTEHLWSLYDASVRTRGLPGTLLADPCVGGGAGGGSIGPEGPPGPEGPAGPEGPEGPQGEAWEPQPCNLELEQCGRMDPDVAWVFIKTFECLEGLGLISDSWRDAFPQLQPTEG